MAAYTIMQVVQDYFKRFLSKLRIYYPYKLVILMSNGIFSNKFKVNQNKQQKVSIVTIIIIFYDMIHIKKIIEFVAINAIYLNPVIKTFLFEDFRKK